MYQVFLKNAHSVIFLLFSVFILSTFFIFVFKYQKYTFLVHISGLCWFVFWFFAFYKLNIFLFFITLYTSAISSRLLIKYVLNKQNSEL